MHAVAGQIADALSHIRGRTPIEPRVGMILGTGLGGLATRIAQEAVIPYREIPHFPHSTVQSHAGQLVLGTLEGVPVAAMEGRFHFYEGWSMRQITFPVRVMKALGAAALVVTNAAGGMNPQHELADLLIIEDHINLMPDNPLRGVNDDALGPRVPDLSQPYDRGLIALAKRTALELAIPAHTGVLAAVSGPNLETRAEYRMLRALGADVVSMSTVPEVIVAAHAGLRTLGFSVITDLCLPDALEPANIEKILEVAAIGGERLSRLIPKIVAQLEA
jgi:purine-nucleoside phosphorylase